MGRDRGIRGDQGAGRAYSGQGDQAVTMAVRG
jgi:hypothetical protein